MSRALSWCYGVAVSYERGTPGQVGEVVTGLKGRPSSVAVELHYNGQPYEELLANSMVEEEYKKVFLLHGLSVCVYAHIAFRVCLCAVIYNGQPYEELLANSMVEEEYKKGFPLRGSSVCVYVHIAFRDCVRTVIECITRRTTGHLVTLRTTDWRTAWWRRSTRRSCPFLRLSSFSLTHNLRVSDNNPRFW